MPRSGWPSDWSILTDFAKTRALLTYIRYAIWRRSASEAEFKSVISNSLEDFFPREEEKDNCMKNRSMEDDLLSLLTVISYLFTSYVSYEWKNSHRLHDHDGLSSSRGHERREKTKLNS